MDFVGEATHSIQAAFEAEAIELHAMALRSLLHDTAHQIVTNGVHAELLLNHLWAAAFERGSQRGEKFSQRRQRRSGARLAIGSGVGGHAALAMRLPPSLNFANHLPTCALWRERLKEKCPEGRLDTKESLAAIGS